MNWTRPDAAGGPGVTVFVSVARLFAHSSLRFSLANVQLLSDTYGSLSFELLGTTRAAMTEALSEMFGELSQELGLEAIAARARAAKAAVLLLGGFRVFR